MVNEPVVRVKVTAAAPAPIVKVPLPASAPFVKVMEACIARLLFRFTPPPSLITRFSNAPVIDEVLVVHTPEPLIVWPVVPFMVIVPFAALEAMLPLFTTLPDTFIFNPPSVKYLPLFTVRFNTLIFEVPNVTPEYVVA